MEIILKNSLFNDLPDQCSRCDADIPSDVESGRSVSNSPYGNRAILELHVPNISLYATLCVDCVKWLIEEAQEVVDRLQHKHEVYLHPEYGKLCSSCGMVVRNA